MTRVSYIKRRLPFLQAHVTDCISALDVFVTSHCCVERKRDLKELVTWLCRYSWRCSLSTEGGNCKYGVGKFEQWSSKGWQCWHCTEYSIIHGIFIFFFIELHVKNHWVNCLFFLSESPLCLPGVFLIYEIVRQLHRKFCLKWIKHKYFAKLHKLHLSFTHGIISVGYLIVHGRSKNKLVYHSITWAMNGTSTLLKIIQTTKMINLNSAWPQSLSQCYHSHLCDVSVHVYVLTHRAFFSVNKTP